MPSPLDVGHTETFEGTAGFPTSIGESFDSVFDLSYRVDSLLGLETEVQSRWEKSIREYEAATGTKTGIDTSIRTVGGLINPMIDPGKERGLARSFQGLDFTLYGPGDGPEERLQKAREFNDKIRSLNSSQIRPIEDVLEEVLAQRQLTIERSEAAAETTGFLGTIAGFAGGIAGTLASAFSGRDPVQLGTLFVGGGGKNVATRIASEFAVNAAAEGIVQQAGIQPTRKALGEPESDILSAMLTAGAAGGALRGVGEVAGALVSRYLKAEREPITLDFEDRQLREMLGQAPQTPEIRAAQVLLTEDAMFVRANPYADTNAGLRRFEVEVESVLASFSGKTDTAVARLLPEVDDFNIENLDYHSQVVREQRPQVFQAVADTSSRIRELDERIAQLTDQIDNISLAEGVARIDEDTANLIRSYEADLANPQLTTKQREDIIRRADQAIKSIGEAAVERELVNAGIAPRKELQRLRQERKAATKRFREARDIFDRAVNEVKALERIKEITTAPGVLRSVPASPINPVALRKDVVEATTKAIDSFHEQIPEVSESIVQAMETEEGLDLGDGVVIPKDFRIQDPDNPAKEISAAQLYRRLLDDEGLVEAMRTCAL